LVVLDLPIFSLVSLVFDLREYLWSLDIERGILLEIAFDGMDIEEMCFWGKFARPWFMV
jgi:hypothetical protein